MLNNEGIVVPLGEDQRAELEATITQACTLPPDLASSVDAWYTTTVQPHRFPSTTAHRQHEHQPTARPAAQMASRGLRTLCLTYTDFPASAPGRAEDFFETSHDEDLVVNCIVGIKVCWCAWQPQAWQQPSLGSLTQGSPRL